MGEVSGNVSANEPKNIALNELFNQLVREHSRKLYTHIRSIIMDHEQTNDILQNTFMKAWQSYGSFRGDAQVSTWLFRIATNEALQHLRKQKTRKLLNLFYNSQPNSGQSDDFFTGEDIRLKLEKALQTLTVHQRMIFSMKYYNDMKYSEMSQVLNLSEGTLKATYHQVSKKIETMVTHLSLD
ncbi:MAG: RNA polymerase sigma factor [Bacteroidales bacterium]|nr:RNA polymerase sigma factor [Bacteroidales bacterium]